MINNGLETVILRTCSHEKQSMTITWSRLSLPRSCRFRVFVDEKFAADGFTSFHKLNLEMQIKVTLGTHQLRIAKLEEGSKGEAVLNSIQLSPGAR